jgi:mRNA interferase RelE/StbE
LYKLALLPAAQKFYTKLYSSDRTQFDRISKALESLRNHPLDVGKPLRHELKGKYSLRVGMYRIIYQVKAREITVFILDIGHRRDVYQ